MSRFTDADYDAQKARVEAVLERWVRPTGLGWWRLSYEWLTRPIARTPDAAARCTVDFQYHHALIQFNLPMLADEPDDELELTVVHELCHLFTLPIMQVADDEKACEFVMEHQTSAIARSLIWLREHCETPAVVENAP